jgi:ribosomal protein S18 acetylase RimI-like enzyme
VEAAVSGEPVIRRAIAADAEALASLAERTFVEAFGSRNRPEDLELHLQRNYGAAIQRREILDPEVTTFVVEEAGFLLAYVQLAGGEAPPEVAGAKPVEIRRFYVDAPWHGRGLAQRLMATALEFAGTAGAGVVWLGVWEENPRGIAFYRKCGFAAVGSHVFVVGNDPQRDLLMAKPLANP